MCRLKTAYGAHRAPLGSGHDVNYSPPRGEAAACESVTLPIHELQARGTVRSDRHASDIEIGTSESCCGDPPAGVSRRRHDSGAPDRSCIGELRDAGCRRKPERSGRRRRDFPVLGRSARLLLGARPPLLQQLLLLGNERPALLPRPRISRPSAGGPRLRPIPARTTHLCSSEIRPALVDVSRRSSPGSGST